MIARQKATSLLAQAGDLNGFPAGVAWRNRILWFGPYP
jgi:hypothetical protein